MANIDAAAPSLPAAGAAFGPRRAFALALVLSLMMVWSPIKPLAYLAPYIFLFAYAIAANRAAPLLRLGGLFLGGAVMSCFYWLVEPSFAPQDALLSFMTWSSFISLACLSRENIQDSSATDVLFKVLPPLLVIEGTIGILQAAYAAVTQTGSFDSDNGDWVTGTIQLGSAHGSFSNPMFAANVGGMLLALVGIAAALKKPVPKAALVIGTTAFMMASVVHAIGMLFAAILGAAILLPRSARSSVTTLAAILLLIALAVGAMYLVVPDNIREFAQYSNAYTALPKTQFILRVFGDMPQEYPQMAIYGFGPGQFGSRAGLIGTGLYFGTPYSPVPLPLLPAAITPQFGRYALDLWFRTLTSIYFGSTGQPFFSWISVYTEFGLIGVAAVGVFMWRFWRRLARAWRAQKLWRPALCCLAGMLFIFMLGFQENYWEVAQAIFIPALCVRVLYVFVTDRA